MQDSAFEVRVARLEERISHIAGAIDEIKEGFAEFRNIGHKIGEALAHNEENIRVVGAQWKKIDELSDRIDQADQFRSSMRGAMWAFGIVMTTIGGVTTAAILWLFSVAAQNDAMNGVQQHRIVELERRVELISNSIHQKP